MAKRKQNASGGHALGQRVGDWFEEYFVLPLLTKVGDHLQLYVDHRFRARPIRGEKLNWADSDGNEVDYDFVLELDGTDDKRGIPVAFLETFWRRGALHSKDKARDDSGKLRPMRATHPSARFLGIVAGGDFTAPARQLVRSREIDLFYIPKAKIIQAFDLVGLQIDYPDTSSESTKQQLAVKFAKAMKPDVSKQIAIRLCELVGQTDLDSYVDRVRAAIGALPQELRIIARKDSSAKIFESISDASAFLEKPHFDFSDASESYVYEVTYSDGTEFERDVASLDEVRTLHLEIERLARHVGKLKQHGL